EDQPGSLNPFATRTAAVTHVGSVDPVGDFNALVSARLHETASRQLEEHIYRLVDDPLTSSLLRPKVIFCLRGYRKAAGESVEMGQAYNRFLRSLHPLLAPISNADLASVGLSEQEAEALVREPLRSVSAAIHGPEQANNESAALDNLLDDLE
ncbi:unnamed protein product, partial [Schistocephalus solidus]|uniref:Ku_PK_bind domain-containing protein n=1 Tax=Schistocephalus solidus TaxID=70667 RepID=A0A183SSR5_SCHSO